MYRVGISSRGIPSLNADRQRLRIISQIPINLIECSTTFTLKLDW